MHVVLQVGDHDRNGWQQREPRVVGGEVLEPQVGGCLDRALVGYVVEANPRDVLACVGPFPWLPGGGSNEEFGADVRQVFGIPLERQPLVDQAGTEVWGLLDLHVGHAVAEPDPVITAREQPEVVALTVVFLPEHLSEFGPFLADCLVDKQRVLLTDDLVVILVLLDHDDDVVVHG